MRKALWTLSLFLLAAVATAELTAVPSVPAAADSRTNEAAVSAVPAGEGTDAAPAAPTRRALVVGVSHYMDARVPELRVAAKDALDVAAVIQDPAAGGWKSQHVEVLTNSQATGANVRSSIRALVAASKPGDLVLVYFSGHSVAAKGRTSLLLADTKHESPAATSLDLDELRQLLSSLSPKMQVLVVLDTHQAGLGEWPPGQSVLAASGVGEKAMELTQNGAFTGLLLRALRGEARNAKGEVTLSDVHAFITAHPPSGQTVQMAGSLPGGTVLALGTQAVAAVSGD